jgi:hypothetical protein
MRKGPLPQNEGYGLGDGPYPHETGALQAERPVIHGPQCQQPLQRIVGRRQSPVLNDNCKEPSRSLQALLVELSASRTRTPKGIFRYATHEEANRDHERWRAAAVAARQSRPASHD